MHCLSVKISIELYFSSFVISIGEQGGGQGGGGSTPSEIFFYDPPLRFKMTPTPSEMAFDPL